MVKTMPYFDTGMILLLATLLGLVALLSAGILAAARLAGAMRPFRSRTIRAAQAVDWKRAEFEAAKLSYANLALGEAAEFLRDLREDVPGQKEDEYTSTVEAIEHARIFAVPEKYYTPDGERIPFVGS